MIRPRTVSLMLELSGRCNQRCSFCYNSWKMEGGIERGELAAPRVRELLGRFLDSTSCAAVSISGGEPLLREDLGEIVAFIKKRGPRVNLITNGTLLTPDTIDRCIANGVDLFQVTLLSDRREIHNRLVGIDGFDRAVEAILEIRNRGGAVSTFFVALADNVETFRSTLELNVLLGVPHVAFGRFTPGGAGLEDWERLMPEPDSIDRALDAANELSGKYRLAVSVSTPILPCLHDLSRFPRVRFAFCGAGGAEHALFGIDPLGNLKACSHSPHLLGNLLERPFERLIEDGFYRDLTETLPAFCRDCPEAAVCRGGCRSSAQVCAGRFDAEDPYLSRWKSRARKPDRSIYFTAGAEPA